MKKKFSEIMDELSPEEADKLICGIEESSDEVTNERLLQLVNERITPAKPRARRSLPKKAVVWMIAAAAVLISLGIGTYAFAADAAEYREAKEFFMENGLDTEGLTRGEIKAIYRDITTERFVYGKTAEVIAHNMMTNSVPGWEILNKDPSAANVQNAWEIGRTAYLNSIHYYCDYERADYEENGMLHLKMGESTIKKVIGDRDNEPIWTFKTDKMRIYWGQEVSHGVLCAGVMAKEDVVPIDGEDDYYEKASPAIIKLDNDGQLVWFAQWDNDWVEEKISGIFENSDGSLTVLSQGCDRENERYSLCVSRIDPTGKYLGTTVNPTEEVWVCDIACDLNDFGGGYIAILYGLDEEMNHYQSVVRIAPDGRLTDEFSYDMGENGFDLIDAAIVDEKIFISCNRKDVSITDEYFGEDTPMGFTVDDFTEPAREARTAVLLVCDPNEGKPSVFYEVKGAFGAELETDDDGQMIWAVNRIESARFVVRSGLYPVDGVTRRIELTFDRGGNLVKKTETDELKHFCV
ncbi:MAG: hypothetical protein IKG85_04575 [Clostridia bacterium]|nr:hypothetical protein [Clostridia bacterium]